MNIKNESKISMDCSTQWIADVLNMGAHSRLRSIIKPQKGHKDGCRDADYCIRFCPECKRTWESQPLGYDNKKIVYFYNHVTGYGKEKEVCVDCK